MVISGHLLHFWSINKDSFHCSGEVSQSELRWHISHGSWVTIIILGTFVIDMSAAIVFVVMTLMQAVFGLNNYSRIVPEETFTSPSPQEIILICRKNTLTWLQKRVMFWSLQDTSGFVCELYISLFREQFQFLLWGDGSCRQYKILKRPSDCFSQWDNIIFIQQQKH